MQDVFHYLIVAVRRFDEKLRLMFAVHPLFEGFQPLGTFTRFDGKIAVESETLPVESRSHNGQDDRRGAHQRNDFQVLSLGNGNNICSRIGYSRTTGFGYHSHRLP